MYPDVNTLQDSIMIGGTSWVYSWTFLQKEKDIPATPGSNSASTSMTWFLFFFCCDVDVGLYVLLTLRLIYTFSSCYLIYNSIQYKFASELGSEWPPITLGTLLSVLVLMLRGLCPLKNSVSILPSVQILSIVCPLSPPAPSLHFIPPSIPSLALAQPGLSNTQFLPLLVLVDAYYIGRTRQSSVEETSWRRRPVWQRVAIAPSMVPL